MKESFRIERLLPCLYPISDLGWLTSSMFCEELVPGEIGQIDIAAGDYDTNSLAGQHIGMLHQAG